MGKIKGMEYSDTRYNEYDEKEYFIDDWDNWFTADEVYDRKKLNIGMRITPMK